MVKHIDYSVHGLVDRYWYKVQSIIIDTNGHGVPNNTLTTNDTFCLMIIYEEANYGRIGY